MSTNGQTLCTLLFDTCLLVEPELSSEDFQQRNPPSREKRSVIYHLMILLLTADMRADQIAADAETDFRTD